MTAWLGLFALIATACAGEDHVVLHGATVVGLGVTDVELRGERIVAIGKVDDKAPRIDVSGRWIVPAFIDSHVHLVYLPEEAAMAKGGVAAAVDLAAPVASLSAKPGPLRQLKSGPMITGLRGYPTQSWGRDGYGREVRDEESARAAVKDLVGLGAGIIKLPLTGDGDLREPTFRAAADEAHQRGLLVASHALEDGLARDAALWGADVLAHTPVAALSAETVAAWKGKTVISTLKAFGSGPVAVDNLRRLREAGATVLYGTDFGNSAVPGIDPDELALMVASGMSPAEVLASGTSVPAGRWGFEGLGTIAVGAEASVLVLDADPLVDVSTLGRPERVWIRGVKRR